MGFSNTLRRNAVNEWKDYYLDYDKLRARIKHRDFKAMLYAEVNKINSFYFLLEKRAVDEKNHLLNDILRDTPGIDSIIEHKKFSQTTDTEQEALGRKNKNEFEELGEIDFANNSFGKSTNESGNDRSFLDIEGFKKFIPIKRGLPKRKKEKYITEFLHSLVKIKAYRDLNANGLLKLAKKYSEILSNEIFYEKFDYKLKETYFYKSKRIDSIRNAVKKMYKKIFAKGQPEKARTVFRRLSRGSKSLDTYYILSGFFSGISLAISCFAYDPLSRSHNYLYCIDTVYFGFILFGLCIKLLKNFSINYKFIFNFDVASSMNNSVYLLMVTSLMLISNIIFHFNPVKSILSTNTLLIIIPLVFLCNPFDCFCLNSRIYFLSAIGRGLLLPISVIRFRHFFFVDVLQSFKYPIQQVLIQFIEDNDLRRNCTFFILIFLPFIRVLQCLRRYSISRLFFPHIANVGKYMLAISVLILELWMHSITTTPDYSKSLLVVLRMVSSFAGFCWDILVDWVIFRNRYMFPGNFYLFAIVANFILRFYNIPIDLFPKYFTTYTQSGVFQAAQGLGEIFRRFVWTAIRVEVEHLNNCDELKIKKSINLTGGELFYKKDMDESLNDEYINLATDTEFETEMEENNDKFQYNKTPKHENESIASEDDSIIEYEESSESLKVNSLSNEENTNNLPEQV